MSNNTPLIEFKKITKKFGDLTVLDQINFSINHGTITSIIGKSGVGKSVLLKHIIGLLEPDEGDMLFSGKKIFDLTKKELKNIRRKFSYMFQNMALFDSMTILENIALPLIEKNIYKKTEIINKAMEKISQLELDDIVNKYPSQISGGMQKRVALARALVTDPEIVLFDEPTTGLDPIRKKAVFDMIQYYQKQFDFTAVVVSHDIPDIFYISHKIALLENAKIVFEGTLDDIYACNEPFIKEFIKERKIGV